MQAPGEAGRADRRPRGAAVRRAAAAAWPARRIPGGSSAGRGGSATPGGMSGTAGAISTGGAEAYPVPAQPPADEDGAELWLRYKKVALPSRLAEYQAALTHVVKAGSSDTLQAAQAELVKGLGGLLGATITVADAPTGDGAVVLGTPTSSTLVSGLSLGSRLTAVGSEGYLIEAANVAGKKAIVVAGNTTSASLHGAFALLRHLQTHRSLAGLSLSRHAQDQAPHPQSLGQPRRHRRARLRRPLAVGLERAAGDALAALQGLRARERVARHQRHRAHQRQRERAGPHRRSTWTRSPRWRRRSGPMGSRLPDRALQRADRDRRPLDRRPVERRRPAVVEDKATEIYAKIPDFGGFLVKANSEGQPGRRRTTAPTPTAPTCSPTRSRAKAAS